MTNQFSSYDEKEMENFKKIAENYIEECSVR